MSTTTPVSSIELKRKLDEALVREREEAEAKVIKEFKDALEGKYFFLRWHWRDGQSVAVARYTAFKPARPDGSNFRVTYDSATATVSISTSKKTRHCFEPVGVRRDYHTQSMASYLSDVTRHHVKEISKEHYQQFWETPRILAEAQMNLWQVQVEAPPLEVSYEEPVESAKIDVPFVTLDAQEKSIVHGSPFILPGGLHLLSPNAKAFVRAKIREEEAIEARCSHLYEACDMRYVEMKRQTIAGLRRKFEL